MINPKRVNSPFESKGTPPVIPISRAWLLPCTGMAPQPMDPHQPEVPWASCTPGTLDPTLGGSLAEGIRVSQGWEMCCEPGAAFSMQGSCPVTAPSALPSPARGEKLGLQRGAGGAVVPAAPTLLRTSFPHWISLYSNV